MVLQRRCTLKRKRRSSKASGDKRSCLTALWGMALLETALFALRRIPWTPGGGEHGFVALQKLCADLFVPSDQLQSAATFSSGRLRSPGRCRD